MKSLIAMIPLVRSYLYIEVDMKLSLVVMDRRV